MSIISNKYLSFPVSSSISTNDYISTISTSTNREQVGGIPINIHPTSSSVMENCGSARIEGRAGDVYPMAKEATSVATPTAVAAIT